MHRHICVMYRNCTSWLAAYLYSDVSQTELNIMRKKDLFKNNKRFTVTESLSFGNSLPKKGILMMDALKM